MDTMFINSKTSKTPEPHRLLFNLEDKINLKEVTNMFPYQILAFTYYTWKIKKRHTKAIELKYKLQREMKNLN